MVWIASRFAVVAKFRHGARPSAPLSNDRAVSHIAAGAGTLFDPSCVEAFLSLMTERKDRSRSGDGVASRHSCLKRRAILLGGHPTSRPLVRDGLDLR